MPAGLLPEKVRNSLLALGMFMVTVAGAMEEINLHESEDANRCPVASIEVEVENHG